MNVLKIIKFQFHLKSWCLLLLLKKIRKPIDPNSLFHMEQLALVGPRLSQPYSFP